MHYTARNPELLDGNDGGVLESISPSRQLDLLRSLSVLETELKVPQSFANNFSTQDNQALSFRKKSLSTSVADASMTSVADILIVIGKGMESSNLVHDLSGRGLPEFLGVTALKTRVFSVLKIDLQARDVELLISELDNQSRGELNWSSLLVAAQQNYDKWRKNEITAADMKSEKSPTKAKEEKHKTSVVPAITQNKPLDVAAEIVLRDNLNMAMSVAMLDSSFDASCSLDLNILASVHNKQKAQMNSQFMNKLVLTNVALEDIFATANSPDRSKTSAKAFKASSKNDKRQQLKPIQLGTLQEADLTVESIGRSPVPSEVTQLEIEERNRKLQTVLTDLSGRDSEGQGDNIDYKESEKSKLEDIKVAETEKSQNQDFSEMLSPISANGDFTEVEAGAQRPTPTLPCVTPTLPLCVTASGGGVCGGGVAAVDDFTLNSALKRSASEAIPSNTLPVPGSLDSILRRSASEATGSSTVVVFPSIVSWKNSVEAPPPVISRKNSGNLLEAVDAGTAERSKIGSVAETTSKADTAVLPVTVTPVKSVKVNAESLEDICRKIEETEEKQHVLTRVRSMEQMVTLERSASLKRAESFSGRDGVPGMRRYSRDKIVHNKIIELTGRMEVRGDGKSARCKSARVKEDQSEEEEKEELDEEVEDLC